MHIFSYPRAHGAAKAFRADITKIADDWPERDDLARIAEALFTCAASYGTGKTVEATINGVGWLAGISVKAGKADDGGFCARLIIQNPPAKRGM